MTLEEEKRLRELILKKLGEWSIDLSQYDSLPLEQNTYTGSYNLEIRHKKTGRRLLVPHIFVNEQTGAVAWNNIEMNQS
jgi:hypothetical protein